MTTQRNNMFYRGAASAYSAILKIMNDHKEDSERIGIFNKLRDLWLISAANKDADAAKSRVDSKTVVTFVYYVTVVDNKFIFISEDESSNLEYTQTIYLWDEETSTNYILKFYGDCDTVVSFMESDDNLITTLAKLVGCANPESVEEAYKLHTVYCDTEEPVSLFELDLD